MFLLTGLQIWITKRNFGKQESSFLAKKGNKAVDNLPFFFLLCRRGRIQMPVAM